MTRVVTVIQARTSSRRLPGKVLQDVAGRPMLLHVIERAAAIAGVAEVVLATSTEASDDPVEILARSAGARVFRGSLPDVLDRYYNAAGEAQADVVIRITADCPLLDPEVSGSILQAFLTGGDVAYASNVEPPTFPDGLDTEVFSFAALERAWREAADVREREHVTPYIRTRPELFPRVNVTNDADLSRLRWTVDHPGDLEFVRAINERLPRGVFSFREVLRVLEREPELAAINAPGAPT